MDAIRICLFRLSMAFSIVQDGNSTKLEGTMGSTMNEAIFMAAKGHEVDFTDKGNIHDCIVSLIKNESDFIFSAVPFGGQDFKYIFPFILSNEVKYTIFSCYNMTSSNSRRFADILKSAVTGLSVEVIVSVIGLLIVFATLIRMSTLTKLRTRHNRCKLKMIFQVYSHFIKQSPLKFDDVTRRLLSYFLSVMSFFVLLATGCVLSTQLVIIDQPTVVTTYNQVINNTSIKVVIPDVIKAEDFGGLNTNKSQNGYFFYKVKDRIVKVSGTGMDPFNKVLDNFDEIIQGRMVVIIPNVADPLMRRTLCLSGPFFTTKMKGFLTFPYYASDPQAEPVPLSFVITQSFRQTPSGHKLVTNVKRAIQAGIWDYPFKRIEPATVMPAEVVGKGDYYQKCMSAMVVMPDVQNTQQVKRENLSGLFKFSGCVVVVTSIVLTVEVIIRQLLGRRKVADCHFCPKCRRRRLMKMSIRRKTRRPHTV